MLSRGLPRRRSSGMSPRPQQEPPLLMEAACGRSLATQLDDFNARAVGLVVVRGASRPPSSVRNRFRAALASARNLVHFFLNACCDEDDENRKLSFLRRRRSCWLLFLREDNLAHFGMSRFDTIRSYGFSFFVYARNRDFPTLLRSEGFTFHLSSFVLSREMNTTLLVLNKKS
uniref:(northern house mosquito) hypothetical protein n=2 Tax=Culex pipiens TaxID=7175 RepID=A0A8D8D1I7_CULPI